MVDSGTWPNRPARNAVIHCIYKGLTHLSTVFKYYCEFVTSARRLSSLIVSILTQIVPPVKPLAGFV